MSKAKQNTQLTALKDWLRSITTDKVRPSVHVNNNYNLAVVVVDFGSPLEPVKLEPEQFTEMTRLIKSATKEVVGRESSVRLSVDNGVYWTSV